MSSFLLAVALLASPRSAHATSGSHYGSHQCLIHDGCSSRSYSSDHDSWFHDDCGDQYYVDDHCQLHRDTCAIVDPCSGSSSYGSYGGWYNDDCGWTYHVDYTCTLRHECFVVDPCSGNRYWANPGSTLTTACYSEYLVNHDCTLTETVPPQPTPTCPVYDSCGYGWGYAYPGSNYTNSCGTSYHVAPDCSLTHSLCGNAYLDVGEECDGGYYCTEQCTHAFCGDGMVTGDEECDGGPDCTPECTISTCGDGIVTGDEACDGGLDCTSECTLAFCGDGIVSAGETCDDGNDDPFDGCLADCQICEGLVDPNGFCLRAPCDDADGDFVCDDDDLCVGDDSFGDSDGDGVCDRAIRPTLSGVPSELWLDASHRADDLRGIVRNLNPGSNAIVYVGQQAFRRGTCDVAHPERCTLRREVAALQITADVRGNAVFDLPMSWPVGEERTLQIVSHAGGGPVVSNPSRLRRLEGSAAVRVVNTDLSADMIDVYIDGVLRVDGLDAADLERLHLPSGQHLVALRESGAPRGSTPLHTSSIDVDPDTQYLLALRGGEQPLGLIRESWGTVDVSAARVRFFSGESPVSIDLDLDGVQDMSLDAMVSSWESGHRVRSLQEHTFGLMVDGEESRFTLPPLDLGDELCLMMSEGAAGQPSLIAISRDDELRVIAHDPTVHLLHAGPSATPVGLSVHGADVQVAPGSLSRVWAHAGDNVLDLHGSSHQLSLDGLERGREYLVALIGEDASGLPESTLVVAAPPASPRARVVLANGAAGVSSVDIGVITSPGFRPAVNALAFGTSTHPDGFQVPPGTYTLGVRWAGQSPVPITTTVDPGTTNIYVLSGDGMQFSRVRTDGPAWTLETLR